jgi:cell division protein FtsB
MSSTPTTAKAIWMAFCVRLSQSMWRILYHMREFNDRRLLRNVFFSWGTVIVLAVLLFFSARGLLSVYERYGEAKKLRYAAEERLSGLEERRNELQAAVGHLESERGFEKEVRKRYGVVRPGEGVIQIVDTPASTSETVEKRSFLERLLDLF